MRHFIGTVTASALLLVAATACASSDTAASPVPVTTGAAPSPYNSVSTGLPPGVGVPSGAPKTPTDIQRSPGWVEGQIVEKSTGPCYRLLDFDGKPYALYSDAGTTLAKGDHVRVKISPSRLRIHCGEGEQVRMEAVEHVS